MPNGYEYCEIAALRVLSVASEDVEYGSEGLVLLERIAAHLVAYGVRQIK